MGRREPEEGSGWSGRSARLRASWAEAGIGCVDAQLGGCVGPITADHVVALANGGRQDGPLVPRCRRHNSIKGTS